MATLDLYVGNDNLIEVSLLRDVTAADGVYLNAATVEATLKDGSGDDVAGQSWPTTLVYVSASDGKYQGNIDDTATLVNGRLYTAVVTADAGAGQHLLLELETIAKTRKG